ncbi:unnamed protein product [Cuscuta europaea]|uniref:Alpha 1,4-glycosyltransferase domain-containing protein n=1 Tax=Cuscuta europaea TaxID=41803 RepID=A0A9P0YJI4_CUSEU|nr:unnamed protein product [Cuscuta europaea]
MTYHPHSCRFSRTKLHVFSTTSLAAAIAFVIFFSDTFIDTSSTSAFPSQKNPRRSKPLNSIKEDYFIQTQASARLVPPSNLTARERMKWFKNSFPQFGIFKSNEKSRKFHQRVKEFYNRNRECKVRFFMTWIASADSFGTREFLSMESIFKAHKTYGCLIILSQSLDSEYGKALLDPLIESGFAVIAVMPDLPFLLKNTPVEDWYTDLRNGKKDPGEIPFAQNLSNLIRLAVLYKYGGAFLDTDFIVMKNFSGLRNAIGAQSVDLYGNWTRLNNAVLVFDKGHPLIYKFMEEFSLTFDGNKWGQNGPYLVSRVVERVQSQYPFRFRVLPPMAFYPVDWLHIDGFFKKPMDEKQGKWVEAKMARLREEETYGVHLWNRQSRGKRIEKGSIIGKIFSQNCIICKGIYDS